MDSLQCGVSNIRLFSEESSLETDASFRKMSHPRLQKQSDRKDNALPQRTWFITGVNSGFGRIMTEHLLERGDRVAGTARKLEQLHDLKSRYGEQLWLPTST